MSVKGRIVLKLGGGLITNKNHAKTLDKTAIDRVCNILKVLFDDGYRIIIVHGAGSYGHILSKEMKISDGIIPEIYEKQIIAINQIRDDMKELNDEVRDSLQKVDLESNRYSPSDWATNTGKDFIGNIEMFKKEKGEKIPISYGDVVQKNDEKEFGILSGDDLMYRISREIPNVIYTIFLLGDVDGVMDNPPRHHNATLVPVWSKYDSIITLHNSKIDVTGGMDLKLMRASEIAKKIENVWFINGNNPERILELIRTGTTIGTKINP